MDLEVLQELGLTKTEARLYIALVKIGETTTTKIIKDTGLRASKVYEYLARLVKRGLVSCVIKSNKHFYTPVEPHCLKELVKEKRRTIDLQENRLASLVIELNKLKQEEKEEGIKYEVFEGIGGIKSVYEKILAALEKGETQYVIGAPRAANELVEPFLLDWHKRRIKKGVKCKYIYDSNVRDYGRMREKMRFTQVRYLPEKIVSPVWVEVFKNCVAIALMRKKSAVLFLIKEEEVAASFLDYFKLLWRISKK